MNRAQSPSDHTTGCPWWSRERLREALTEEGGNRAAVARRWGASGSTIEYWVEEHGLEEF